MSMTTFFTDARDIAEKTNELYCIKAMDFFFSTQKQMSYQAMERQRGKVKAQWKKLI